MSVAWGQLSGGRSTDKWFISGDSHMTDRVSEAPDADKTETERSLRERVPSEQRPAILWTFPKYGLVTAPERRCVIGRAESCGAQLEGSKISREHAEISPV